MLRSLATARRSPAVDPEAARSRLRALTSPPSALGDAVTPGEEPMPPPAGEVPRRWAEVEIGRSAALGLVLLGAVVVAVTALVVLRHRPVPVQSAPVMSKRPPASTPVASTRPAVTVDVAGRVSRPGLVRLAAGSRVADAVAAAGGPKRPSDLGLLNLAAPLVDGEQIVVGGMASAAGAGAPGGGAAASDPSGLVDVNTATESDLDTLPGIGPVLAQHILDFRTAHNGFTTVDELQQVPGIGPAKFAQLKARVRV